jgi:hypothetical protein
MKNKIKLFLAAAALIGTTASAQLVDEKDVSITLDLQPVLQLDMSTPDQLEFVFDEIREYQAGIVRYAATILKVSSTVNWDLYAIGRSQGNNGPTFWDQQLTYGNNITNSIPNLPLSLLELKQAHANPALPAAANVDYSSTFSPATTPSGANSIYTDIAGGGAAPLAAHKYIAGHAGTTGVEDFMPGGSYLSQIGGISSDFYYSFDYRILPGLPAVFPMAHAADGTTSEALTAGTYAQPGIYTMYVQYVLLEDQ